MTNYDTPQKLHLFTMFNLLLTLQELVFFLHYHTLQKISSSLTNSLSNYLTSQTDYITLCNMLLKYKTCYANHKNDNNKISTPFRIRFKPDAQLITQRPSKVPIHYRDKFNTLLKELEKYNIIKQIGSSPQDKPAYGTTYLNLLIIIPKGDTIKFVLDARHLNSNTEQSDEFCPIESLAPQLTRAKRSTNVQSTLCTPMQIHPLKKRQSNLQVSHQVTNSLPSLEDSMVSKDFQIALKNKCRPSLKFLRTRF